MVASCIHCVNSLLWAFVLLFFVMYAFGMVFIQATIGAPAKDVDDLELSELERYFGSYPQTMLSLFQCISGGTDWGDPAGALRSVGWQYEVAFCLYVFITMIALLNVVTGLFVESATKAALTDKVFALQDAKEAHALQEAAFRDIFHEVCPRDGDVMDFDKFELLMKNKKVRVFCESTGIDVSRSGRLFHFLDVSKNGVIDQNEFVDGCLRLRGGTESV